VTFQGVDEPLRTHAQSGYQLGEPNRLRPQVRQTDRASLRAKRWERFGVDQIP